MIFSVALLKLCIILLLAYALFQVSEHKKISVGHFLLGWMIEYLIQIFILLILSINRSITQTTLMTSMLILLFACIVSNILIIRKRKKSLHFEFGMDGCSAYGVLIIAAVYLIIRSLYCFDSTHDAMVYGMPRILLFAQEETILSLMDTRVTNIFSNEWNAELNAVFYRVITGDNQAIPFASVENYVYGIFAIAYCCNRLLEDRRTGNYTLLAYMLNPVVFFISMTCKGDFLPMVLLPLFCVCAYDAMYKYKDKQQILMMLLSGSLCAGSKITMIPCVGLIMLFFLVKVFVEKKFQLFVQTIILCIPIYVLGCLRYVINFFQYGNFFQRVEVANEQLRFSVDNLKISFSHLIDDFFNPENVFAFSETFYAVNSDSGYAILGFCVIGVIVILTHVRASKKVISKSKVWFGILLSFSVVFMMSTTVYQPFSYRYYFPFIGVFTLALLAVSERLYKGKDTTGKKIWREGVVFLAMIGACCCVLWSEKTGDMSNANLAVMSQRQGIEREMGINYWLLDNPSGQPDVYDFYDQIKTGKRILICLDIDQICSYLFGENNGNDITLCSPEGLAAMLDDGWDAISISTHFDLPYSDLLLQQGYVCYEPYYLEQQVWIKENKQ